MSLIRGTKPCQAGHSRRTWISPERLGRACCTASRFGADASPILGGITQGPVPTSGIPIWIIVVTRLLHLAVTAALEAWRIMLQPPQFPLESGVSQQSSDLPRERELWYRVERRTSNMITFHFRSTRRSHAARMISSCVAPRSGCVAGSQRAWLGSGFPIRTRGNEQGLAM